jgi:uncharacterized protein YoxC
MIHAPKGGSIMCVSREADRYSLHKLDIPQPYTPTPDGFERRMWAWVGLPDRYTIHKAKSASSGAGASVTAGSIVAANTGANRQEGGTMSEVRLPQHSSSKQCDREAIPVSLEGSIMPRKKATLEKVTDAVTGVGETVKGSIMPREKMTLEKVTDAVTGVSETVEDVGKIVGGIAGAVSEVAHTIREQVEQSPRKRAAQKPQPATTARAKPRPKTEKASPGTKPRASRQRARKR